MANCSLCGKEELMFTCPYCRGVYCVDHRLPEGHGCAGMQKVKDGARRKIADSFTGQYEDDEYDEDIIAQTRRVKVKKPRRRRFTDTEIKDLGIATVLTILVGISIMGGPPIGILNGLVILPVYFLSGLWWFPTSVILIFWLSFMIHEFAHKFTAQRYGMYAHFRMTMQGYYLSAVAILFAIPIFGTGVMQVGGARDIDDYSKSTVAGPLSNLIVAGLLFITAEIIVITTGTLPPFVDFIIYYGMLLNSFLGLFNMIPIPGFDGSTIFRWSRPLWVVLTISLLSTLLMGYFVIPIL
ncbi:MAG: AN1-type zinc finger domain-containing protein [Candidatus Thorarchaeota archaeon]|jgi:Zn-dependent protease